MPSDESVTRWIRGLQAGDGDAARPLWDRYFERLVRLARSRLEGGLPLRAADHEDVALSAFASFCRRAEQGQFSELENRDNLWPLLAKITVRKAAALARHECRRKRGGGAVRGESAWAGQDDEDGAAGIEQVLAADPTPESVVACAEQCDHLLGRLTDPTLRSVALWKLQGHSNREIADVLGVVERTVERKLAAIRELWHGEEVEGE
jgi:DNA-directed RNA polymerase specialized sigma24 family protein